MMREHPFPNSKGVNVHYVETSMSKDSKHGESLDFNRLQVKQSAMHERDVYLAKQSETQHVLLLAMNLLGGKVRKHATLGVNVLILLLLVAVFFLSFEAHDHFLGWIYSFSYRYECCSGLSFSTEILGALESR